MIARILMRAMLSILCGYITFMVIMAAFIGKNATTVEQNMQICLACVIVIFCYLTYKGTFKE